jgi:hypothetical protein
VKNLLLLLLLSVSFLSILKAQDTIKVQTFKWDDTHRADTFDFPDDPDQTYRKILMKYNMRCHDAVVGNGSTGCYEWDYSCNTFITDPSRVDSSRATAPDYTISNFSGNAFPYSLTPTYVYTSYTHHDNIIVAGDSTSEALFFDPGPSTHFTPSTPVYRYQVILPASTLVTGNMKLGPVYGIRVNLIEPGTTLNFLKIRLKNTDQTIPGSGPDDIGLLEVFHKNADVTGGTVFPFYQPFEWNGQNLLVDISFTTDDPASIPAFESFASANDNMAIECINTPAAHHLYFGGAGHLDLQQTALTSIQDEITVSFWAYGDPSLLPANTQLLDGRDAGNRRQANVHLPWSNGEVYWDCGNDGNGYDRINKPVPTTDFEGKWSHWAFTKNATTGVMNIYLNGQLFHSGTGKTKKIDLDAFRFGAGLDDTNPYFGNIDEIQVWDKALDQNTIAEWMSKPTDPTHPFYDHLRAYYPLNEGTGNIASDASPLQANGDIFLPGWRATRGNELFHNFSKTNLLPMMVFLQGDFSIEDTSYEVLDSTESTIHQIIHFGVEGTDLVRLDTQYLYPAGNRPVYNESGVQTGTVHAAPDGTIDISTLSYYAKQAARYELLSLVTPYGIGLDLTPEGKTFTFDVTDFGPILKGRKRLSIEYGGENQEELDIEFWYITGTPERDVLDIQNIWPQGRGYFNEIQSDTRFEPRQVPLLPSAAHYKIRSAITGHEQNGEFVSREHYINVKGGTQEFTYDVWKECSRNPIYPQGGTWVFDRAGWCPGMATDVHEFSLDEHVTPGETIEIDYGVNGPTMASANYLVNNLLVTYGAYNHALDASIEAIIRPNNTHVEYARLNPACNTPTILIKNTGEEYLESMSIQYATAPWNAETYFWTGFLGPQETEEVVLPQPADGFWQEGGYFTVTILQVNEVEDGNPENNVMQSTFEQARVYNYTDPVQLRLQTNNTGSDYFYTIKNESGSVVLLRNNLASNTVYTDDLIFPSGCYSLDLRDSGQDGLAFWFFPENGNGSLRIQRKLQSGGAIPLYSFNPDFGGGVRYDFHLGALVSSTEETTQGYQLFSTYPNPTNDAVNIDLIGFEGKELSFRVTDLTGKILITQTFRSESGDETAEIDLIKLVPGMYVLQATDGVRNFVREVIVSE